MRHEQIFQDKSISIQRISYVPGTLYSLPVFFRKTAWMVEFVRIQRRNMHALVQRDMNRTIVQKTLMSVLQRCVWITPHALILLQSIPVNVYQALKDSDVRRVSFLHSEFVALVDSFSFIHFDEFSFQTHQLWFYACATWTNSLLIYLLPHILPI